MRIKPIYLIPPAAAFAAAFTFSALASSGNTESLQMIHDTTTSTTTTVVMPVVEATTTSTLPPIRFVGTVAPRTVPVAAPARPVAAAKAAPSTTQQATTTSTTAAKKTPLEIAEGEIGKAGSYSAGGFWCHKFVGFALGREFSSPSDVAAKLTRVDDPRPGDVALLQLDPEHEGEGQISHVGLVAAVADGKIHTIERNPVSGSDVVVRFTRSLDDATIVGFAR